MGTANQPAYGLEQPALTLKLQGRDKAQTYTFGKPQEGDYYVLKTSEQAPYFKVPATELEALINLKRAALAKHKPNQAEGTTAPSDSTG